MAIQLSSPLILYIESALIRFAMIEKIEKQQLKEITIEKSKIIWIKKNKECLIGNVLFDVKKITYHQQFAKLTGLYDFEETALKKQFSKNENGKESSSNLITIIYKVIHETFYSSISEFEITLIHVKDCSNEFRKKEYSFQFYRNIFQPPSLS